MTKDNNPQNNPSSRGDDRAAGSHQWQQQRVEQGFGPTPNYNGQPIQEPQQAQGMHGNLTQQGDPRDGYVNHHYDQGAPMGMGTIPGNPAGPPKRRYVHPERTKYNFPVYVATTLATLSGLSLAFMILILFTGDVGDDFEEVISILNTAATSLVLSLILYVVADRAGRR